MNRILLLQCLRGVAALSVAVRHLLHEPYGGADTLWLASLPWQAGVDVFFVISGFVMVHASGRLFGTAGASRVFLSQRLARIVPLYWATTTVFLLIAAMLPGDINSPFPGLAKILASYAFIPWPGADGGIQPVYSLGWTLNYEMLFYGVFALFLPLARFRAVTAVAVALSSVVIAGWVFRTEQPTLAFWCDPIILEFVLGMGLAQLAARGLVLPTAVRLALVVLGFMLIVLMPANALGIPPFMAGAGLLVAASVLGPEPRLRPLVATSMGRLGDSSYALYLMHPFALRALTVGWRALGLRDAPVAASVVSVAALVLALGLALFTHVCFEAPLTRRLRDWSRAQTGGPRRRTVPDPDLQPP